MRHVCPECGEAGDRGTCARDGAVRTPVGADGLLGERIGSWRVACLLGAGGMGRVYKAVQPEIGARVAIKVLKREAAADPELVERFFNEARAVNVIRHDSIVDVIDLGRLPDGAPYIVMEYLEGASLNALLRRPGQLPLGTFVRWIAEALDALAAAHAKGVVHRDLKPDNLFVSPTGRVTVLDFGIAKLGGLAGLVGGTTQTGSLLGTPAYMAPEQARSQPVDARADLYAAGVILFEGATGKPPFAAASLYELLDLHVKTPPARPRSLEPAIPEALEAVILRALAKAPEDRPESAEAMRAALLAAVEGLPSEAFAQVTIASPVKAGQPSDPHAATAATHASQSSLAHGETVPSSPPAPGVPPKGIELRRTTVLALGAAAVLGVGAAIAMVARGGSSERPAAADAAVIAQTPPPAVPDAALAAPDAALVVPDPAPADAQVIAVVTSDASPRAPVVVDAGARHASVDALVAVSATEAPAGEPPSDAAVVAVAPPPPASPQALREHGAVTMQVGDLRHFDVFKGYAQLRAAAERLTGGNVVPISANWSGVGRDGSIDVTAGGYATYWYVMTGAMRDEERCLFGIELKDGTAIGMIGAGNCAQKMMLRPECTITQLRDKAIKAGMPERVERLHLNRIGRTWAITVEGGGKDAWSEQIRDDCAGD